MAVLTKEWQVIATGPVQYFGGTPAYLILYGKYISQSIENNTTTYQIDMHLNTGSGYIGNYQSTPYNIQATGNPSRKDADQGAKDYYSGYIDSLTTTVTHNNDGTKSVSVSGGMNFTAWGQILGVEGSADLPTIPRASSLTATDAYIGSATTITINKASSSFTSTITYSFGSPALTGTIATKTANTSVGWTVPTTFYAKIPNAKYGTCTLTCQTYSGNTLIGTKTTTFTATANPSLCSPIITGSVVDTNSTTTALTGDNTKLVKYYSTASITYSTTAQNSASIVSTKINNVVVSSSPYSIYRTSTNNFVLTTTDSRGYSTSITLTPTMINYIPLTVSPNFYRTSPTTGQVSLSFSGNYFNDSFGSQSNSLQLKWYYKLKNDTNWTTGGTLVQNTDYVITNNTFHSGTSSYEDDIIIGSSFDYTNAYDFKIEYTDKLISNSIIKTVTKGQPIFWWNEEKLEVIENLKIDKALIVDGYVKNDLLVEDIKSKNMFPASEISINYTNQYYSEYNTGIEITSEMIDKGITLSFDCYISSVTTTVIPQVTLGYGNSAASGMAMDIGSQDYDNASTGYHHLTLSLELTNDYYGKYIVIRFVRFSQLSSVNATISNIQLEYGLEETDFVDYKTFTNEHEYSQAERYVGKWIDGSNVYEKVIEITPTVQSTTYNHGISNLDKVISANGFYIRSGSGYQNMIPSNYTNWEVFLYDFTSSTFIVKFSNAVWNSGVYSMFIIIRYTRN